MPRLHAALLVAGALAAAACGSSDGEYGDADELDAKITELLSS